jgi:hypothetical protein
LQATNAYFNPYISKALIPARSDTYDISWIEFIAQSRAAHVAFPDQMQQEKMKYSGIQK